MQNITGAYYKKFGYNDDLTKQRKFLPYAVKVVGGRNKVAEFREFLREEGFEICSWNDTYDVILVSMRFRRAAMLSLPCTNGCKQDRLYSVEEFMDEVYYKRKPPKTRKKEWDLYYPKEKMIRYRRITYKQYLSRVRKFCKQKYLPELSAEELDALFKEQDEYLFHEYDVMSSLLKKQNVYRKEKDFMHIEQTAYTLSLMHEGFELSSSRNDTRPFRYKTLEEYIEAIKKWIRYGYDWDYLSHMDIPATIESHMIEIEEDFEQHYPADDVAVEIMMF